MTVTGYKKMIRIGLIILTISFILLAFLRSTVVLDSDFGIFWVAGGKFSANEPFYIPMIYTGFVYPPFAAMIFQFLALLPLETSAILFKFVFDYLLWIYSFYLLYRILKILFPATNLYPAIIFSFIASARYYLHNYISIQVNVLVLCCILLGILFYLQNKYTRCYIFLLAACFIKITPVVFLLFVAFKRGYKDWGKIFLCALPFIILPFLFRGFDRGINDWVDYYRSFFAQFITGYTDNDVVSLGIPAFLKKMNSGSGRIPIGPLFSLQENALKTITFILQGGIALLVVIRITYDHYKNKATALIGVHICLLFLLALLLPGRVWEHHHVPCAFIFAYLFIFLTKQGLIKTRNILAITCIIIGLIGLDTVGQTLYLITQYFSLITFLMIAIAIILMVVADYETIIPGSQRRVDKV